MRFFNEKNNKTKIDGESLKLYALVGKATYKLLSEISNSEELNVD